MRRIFEWVGGFALIAFSFYVTDCVSSLVANKSVLMQEIEAVSETYYTEPVDAVIDTEENSIIPGKFGRAVDSKESYLSMHDFGSFNENYLVFEYVKPDTSLEDNKDKYIISGNPNNRSVSLIVYENEQVSKYLTSINSIFEEVLTSYRSVTTNVEIINGANNKEDFNTINSNIKTTKLCLKGTSDLSLCLKNEYYILDPKLQLTKFNINSILSKIEPGALILITSSAKLEDVKLIINEIEYKDLNIVSVSDIINEKENS